jgi:hypothetical protein
VLRGHALTIVVSVSHRILIEFSYRWLGVDCNAALQVATAASALASGSRLG